MNFHFVDSKHFSPNPFCLVSFINQYTYDNCAAFGNGMFWGMDIGLVHFVVVTNIFIFSWGLVLIYAIACSRIINQHFSYIICISRHINQYIYPSKCTNIAYGLVLFSWCPIPPVQMKINEIFRSRLAKTCIKEWLRKWLWQVIIVQRQCVPSVW